MKLTAIHTENEGRQHTHLTRVFQIWLSIIVLFFFLIALELITQSCQELDSGFTSRILQATDNPFVSLSIGLLATAIIQSSSTTTASLVAMVAGNVLPFPSAVYMVIGANIGTTVTSLIVSLGVLGTPKAFRRGFMVGSSHLIFNILSAIIFFVLEEKAQLLSNLSTYVAHNLSHWKSFGASWKAMSGTLIRPISDIIFSLVQKQPGISLIIGLILLFSTIYLLMSVFRWMILGKAGGKVVRQALAKPWVSLLSGMGITAAIHSSSVTTSLSVLLASTQKISPKKIFPYIIGANVGTTITALMAAIGRSESAIAIALCHLFFNLGGAIIFFPLPKLRDFPMQVARWTATMAYRYFAFGFLYMLLIFFVLPFLVIFLFERF